MEKTRNEKKNNKNMIINKINISKVINNWFKTNSNYLLTDNRALRERQILKLKKELAERYIYLMCIILLLHIAIYLTVVKDLFLAYYLSAGVILLLLTLVWLRIYYRSLMNKIVHAYFIIAPIYGFYIILQFWNVSVGEYAWLIPLPFGIYIFFGRKEVIFYSLYCCFIIILAFLFNKLFTFNFTKHTPEQVHYKDTLLILSNVLVVGLLAYYKDEIREVKTLIKIEEKEKITLPVTLNEKVLEMADSLFEKIEHEVVQHMLYINPDLNISTLSTILKISNNYISKAIRVHGYTNFNHYINSHRISYVKKIIEESDMKKITLMYIYTEAGFTSQSTFNRVFKQLEGITPSEYMEKFEKQDNSLKVS